MTETLGHDIPNAEPETVARAGTYYRNARYILATLMFAAGLWFAYDGFVNWPSEQRRYEAATTAQQALMTKPHNDASILIQRLLAFALIPLAPVFLAFILYNSRGTISLIGNTLHAPGHPPVPLESITELDKKLWERKGIAFAQYQLGGTSKPGWIKLDDFVYQRDPIQAIVKRIETSLVQPVAENEEANPDNSEFTAEGAE